VVTDEKQPWDIAAYLYQEVWHAENDPSRKVTIFIGGTGGPDDPQFSNWNVFTAVEAFGPMAWRPHDRMGLAWSINGLSKNFRRDVSPVIDIRSTAWNIELYYNLAINKWLHLTPDLHFAQNQNGDDQVAVIPGVRLVIDF
jgi:carbohydrate-selective porin OprB